MYLDAQKQLGHDFEENKIESQKVRSSSQKYKQKIFKLEENTIFIENISPLKVILLLYYQIFNFMIKHLTMNRVMFFSRLYFNCQSHTNF